MSDLLFHRDATPDNPQKRREIELAWGIHNQTRLEKRIALAWRLAEAQNWRCCYCGVTMAERGCGPTRATFEHIVPKSCDGKDDESNLVMACIRCNSSRGSEFWPEHLEALQVETAPNPQSEEGR